MRISTQWRWVASKSCDESAWPRIAGRTARIRRCTVLPCRMSMTSPSPDALSPSRPRRSRFSLPVLRDPAARLADPALCVALHRRIWLVMYTAGALVLRKQLAGVPLQPGCACPQRCETLVGRIERSPQLAPNCSRAGFAMHGCRLRPSEPLGKREVRIAGTTTCDNSSASGRAGCTC